MEVVIPVYNAAHWLSYCLEALFKNPTSSLENVIVVDDHSELGQTKKIAEIVARFPKAVLYLNTSDKRGFGAACNFGTSQSLSSHILFLNSDCLVAPNTLEALAQGFSINPENVLVCPVSNNSPSLSFPMLPGFSYLEMSSAIAKAFETSPLGDQVLEASTIVGNCLAVRKDFFQSVGGFSDKWGIGYGEETDLQMKALRQGLRGVVNIGAYVYHFGGGTFNYEVQIEEHRARNLQIFLRQWQGEFEQLEQRCANNPPLLALEQQLEIALEPSQAIALDVLFYLPCIDQEIGGIHAIIGICNELILAGIKAGCALVGESADIGIASYREPILFGFLRYTTDEEFVEDKNLRPKLVFSSIFYSSPVVAAFAKRRAITAIQFVQGYEVFFYNGSQYPTASKSYSQTSQIVTSSAWLTEKVSRHLAVGKINITRLPLVVNEDIFFSSDLPRQYDVGMVFRQSADKGQWLLAEILDSLPENIKIVAFCGSSYSQLKKQYESRIDFIDLPIDRYALAGVFRKIKVFVDCSIHEGFGLLPLEAALCGCAVVSSDSGGVRDYAKELGVDLLPLRPDAQPFIEVILRRLHNFVPQSKGWISRAEAVRAWQQYLSPMIQTQELNFQEWYGGDLPEYSPNPSSSLRQMDAQVIHHTFYQQYVRPLLPMRLHLALKALIRGHLN